MSTTKSDPQAAALPVYFVPSRETDWGAIRDRFLEAVDPAQREQVGGMLRHHGGSPGLRAWLQGVASGAWTLPPTIPPPVIQVYVDHPEAMPLHDCASCELRVPIIPGRDYGFEGDPVRVFFPECPRCGGPTGWYKHVTGLSRSEP